MTKLHELDPAFVSRLENWGRYVAPEIRRNISTTYKVCLILAVTAGKEVEQGFAESHPKTEVNEDDARVIEWCMAKAAYRMSAQDRALLIAHYAYRADPGFVCRALRIRRRSWESMLCAAVLRFKDTVELLEGCTSPESRA